MAMRVHQLLSVPWNVIAVEIIANASTPSGVPITYPTPPLKSVPPTTTAAIASNSIPVAAIALPEEV